MKYKRNYYIMIAAASLLFSLASVRKESVNVYAATESVQKNKNSENGNLQIIPAKRLAKAGYIFRLTKDAALFPNFTASQGEQYSKKVVKKLIDKKVRFKVTEYGTAKAALVAHIIDKSGKNQGWVSLESDNIYNINAKKKSLKPLVKAEMKVMNLVFEKGKEIALKEMPQVEKEIKQLHGKNKRIGETSVKQLKKWLDYQGTDGAYKYIPTLLFGL